MGFIKSTTVELWHTQVFNPNPEIKREILINIPGLIRYLVTFKNGTTSIQELTYRIK